MVDKYNSDKCLNF